MCPLPSLVVFKLDTSMVNLDNEDDESEKVTKLFNFLKLQTQLISLKLDFRSFYSSDRNQNDEREEDWIQAIKNMPKLTNLSIRRLRRPQEEFLELENCTGLKKIKIDLNNSFTLLQFLINGLSNLEEIKSLDDEIEINKLEEKILKKLREKRPDLIIKSFFRITEPEKSSENSDSNVIPYNNNNHQLLLGHAGRGWGGPPPQRGFPPGNQFYPGMQGQYPHGRGGLFVQGRLPPGNQFYPGMQRQYPQGQFPPGFSQGQLSPGYGMPPQSHGFPPPQSGLPPNYGRGFQSPPPPPQPQ